MSEMPGEIWAGTIADERVWAASNDLIDLIKGKYYGGLYIRADKVQALIEALEWELKLCKMELEVIQTRAKEDWLDKSPIERAYLSRTSRLNQALTDWRKENEN